jgi:hypothetical protein
MDDELTMEEEERMGELQQDRLEDYSAEEETPPVPKKLSFSQKISQHWLILATAGLFDILAFIPFLDVVVNFIFGLILFLYFGPKKKTASSELLKIGLPVLGGSIVDFLVDSVSGAGGLFPANIGAALIRIALS